MWSSNDGLYIFPTLCILVCAGIAIEGANTVKAKVPALFTFGDSIFDPGNNDFIPTAVKANNPPYGRDFMGGKPTGRFSNGKLSPDFISEALGLKETLPPFLDPQLTTQDLLTGVSFASAGSGLDNLTAELASVIPIWQQVGNFKQYKAHLADLVGEKNASNIIGEAIYLSVTGTNDFGDNYLLLPTRRNQFSVAQYIDFLQQTCTTFIEDMYNLGARKFGVYGLPPMGCVPLEKTIMGQSELKGCIEELNQISVSYNSKLKSALNKLNARIPGIKVVYIDIYYSFLDIVNNPSKYGFEKSDRGCCGTGLVEIGPTCNAATPVTCSDASKSVFWDAVHSTERTYQLTANLVLQNYISKLL
ncbi:hypothetical protein SUGI_0760650 [Cryptomeria japonica]|uniref:GDSL esterase/lipase At2g42990 n=1 Tax=Cryptomeria japonica TaxID=3369 RepID=UPI0024148372|nr:GDSL esterase/lipase At2g42990 [Cryptomeria japonica]GLJ37437.1 hypothetical protein SUGI_0760650 [Cryptomeria japonica]